MKKPLTLLATLALGVLPASAANLTGLWEFGNSSNPGQATVGTDLTFAGTAPVWSASLADDQTDSLAGVITTAAADPLNQIVASHGIAPNGGGAYVNQYSLVFDILSPASSRDSWRSLFQTDPANSNDGDYFIRPTTGVIGVAALTYSGSALDSTSWSRLVLTFDLVAAGASSVNAYVDGSLFYTHTLNGGLDSRFALDSTILLVTDEDGENAPVHLGTVAIYDGALTGSEVAALGAAGRPVPVPEPGTSALGLLSLAALLRRKR